VSEGKRKTLRELFPDARLLCECTRDLDVCPPDCSTLKVVRQRIREWAGEVDSDDV
jgi:hypothetical protein